MLLVALASKLEHVIRIQSNTMARPVKDQPRKREIAILEKSVQVLTGKSNPLWLSINV